MTRLPALFGLVFLACGEASTAEDGGVPRDASASDATVDASASDASASDASASDATVDASAGDSGPDAAVSRIDAAIALLAGSNAVAIDALIHDVAWSEGWPLREGARWLFVTRWDAAPASVALVGDIDAWSTTAHPATRAPTGVHHWVVIDEADFVAPAVGSKYKWWGAPDLYRAPPESTAYGYDDFGEFGWVIPPSDAPHLERFPELRSAFLEATRSIRAWIPAGFVARSSGALHVRTLLLHDGQNLFDPGAFWGGWRADATLASGWGDVVAIGIDNASDRMDAYTHVPDSIAAGSTIGGRANDYLQLITEEVLPFARARYGIRAEGDSLMIAGSSLGGLVSMWIASQRPELAGCVAAMSSTMGWGSIGNLGTSTVIQRWSGHPSVSIYLDSGGAGPCADTDGDGIDDDLDDADNYCVNAQMRDVLVANGYGASDLTYSWEPGAQHDEAAWALRLPRALSACDAMGWVAP